MKGTSYKSALSVSDGVVRPPDISEESIRLYKQKGRRQHTVDEFLEGILSGNRTLLSQAITLTESSLPLHSMLAQEIIERCLPWSGKSVRIGITGVPGVGKSTFIESLGMQLVRSKRKLAVLAIDPSSERTRGSIMGDKTRMEELSAEPAAYIRPSPSAGSLGGVARKTREAIILCEAAGYDTIFIETVGVGQSETAVHSMVDFFLLLMLAGAGDELQGIKRGIMEMADAIAITKADKENIARAERAKSEFTNALHLFPMTESGWVPRVLTCSAKLNTGINEIWETVAEYIELTRLNGYFEKKRLDQSRYWMYETINQTLRDSFYRDPRIQKLLAAYEHKVLTGETTPFTPAKALLEKYFKRHWIKMNLKKKINLKKM
ncbi:MAG TPA: methylmalonyl Co-A mutase-associated GTPase MeaB [Bacteroidales bacterium]|nr:methylmalonyl Co-A mutase-associated GTPase MeaB [Bacteroidales bacterium]